jgi:hypothetical protein
VATIPHSRTDLIIVFPVLRRERWLGRERFRMDLMIQFIYVNVGVVSSLIDLIPRTMKGTYFGGSCFIHCLDEFDMGLSRRLII